MSMHRNGHPWTARTTIVAFLPLTHDGESQCPSLTPSVVRPDQVPHGIGETPNGKEERWTTD
jgi:hypothetical protein